MREGCSRDALPLAVEIWVTEESQEVMKTRGDISTEIEKTGTWPVAAGSTQSSLQIVSCLIWSLDIRLHLTPKFLHRVVLGTVCVLRAPPTPEVQLLTLLPTCYSCASLLLIMLCACARGEVIGHVCLSSLLSVCRHFCLSVCKKNTSSPDPGHPLVLNTFKLCKSLKTTLSVLLARSTQQALKILHFGLAPWACLLTTLRYLAHIIWTTTH